MIELNPALAYWNQRHHLAAQREQILRLIQAVDYTNDLKSFQWAQLMSFVLEFKPDLILELGRGMGNSTCAYTQAAHQLGKSHRVTSICLSEDWDDFTQPHLSKVVPQEWFEPLDIVRGDILLYDYETLLKDARRVFLFWDAHGFEVAECVLGRILPLLQSREHVVVMHDLTDVRYNGPDLDSYQNKKFWRHQAYDRAPLRIGHIATWVEQSIAITDFTVRNGIALESAEHSYHMFFDNDAQKQVEMNSLLGELFNYQAHWYWFSMEGRGKLTFPLFSPPQPTSKSELLMEIPAVEEVPSVELLKLVGRRLLQRIKRVAPRK